jgi:hypothetical protein
MNIVTSGNEIGERSLCEHRIVDINQAMHFHKRINQRERTLLRIPM